jgi:hypothetical protein
MAEKQARFPVFGIALLTALAASGGLTQAHAGGWCAAPATGMTPLPPLVGDLILSDLNLQLDAGCAAFAPTDVVGDFSGFSKFTRNMVSLGRSCFENLGLNRVAARWNGILQPGATPLPIKVYCGNSGTKVDIRGTTYTRSDIASGLTPGMAGYPAIMVSIDWVNKSKASSFMAAFFHELFHTAGYGHVGGVDYAYLATGCCFESSVDACDLLLRAGSRDDSWWLTAGYLEPAVKWFYGRDGVADELLKSAASSAGTDQRGVLAGLLQFGRNLRNEGKLDETRTKDLIGRCRAAGGGESCDHSFDP